MNKPILCFASLLLLGSATIATAQDERGAGGRSGPGQGMERSAPGGERGGGGTLPRGERGGGGDGASNGASEGASDRAGPDMPRGAHKGRSADDESSGGAGKANRKANASDKSSGAKGEKSADDAKSDTGKSRADRDQEKPDKAAQGKSKDNDAKDNASQAKTDDAGGKADTKQRAAEPAATKPDADKAADSDQARGDRKPPDAAKKADLSGDRGDRVRTAFGSGHDAKRHTDVHIDISVGRRLPRDWDFVPVPVAVIAVVPEYEGYVYAYVDDEYVICDPDTYEVVAVLPSSGGSQHASRGGSSSGGGSAGLCSASLTLTDDERADILRSVQLSDEADVANVTVGFAVPSDIELRSFPEPVVSRTGKLSACRYFVVDDQIAIVDPQDDKVVMMVEEK